MKMIKMTRWSLLALVMTFTFTACEDGLLDGVLDGDHEESFFTMFLEAEDDIDLSCAEFVYPLTATNPDGTMLTINDEDELETAIQNAIDNDVFPTLIFPIQVIDDNDVITDIATDEALCDLFMDCFDWDNDDDDCDCDEEEECFEFNFPLTIILPDSSTITANDWDELENAVDNYFDANPNDDDEDISFAYPITVTMLDDNSVVTINDDDELEELFEDCYGEFEECFDLQYPISIAMPDGTTATANSEEELDSLYDAWFDANPSDSTEPTLIFPITVVYEDGSTETVNDEDELEELFEECYGDDWDDCGKISGSDVVIGTKSSVAKRVILKTNRIKKYLANDNSVRD